MSKKYKSSVEKMSVVMEKILSDKGYLSACYENEVVERWPDIAGNRLAKETVCDRCENGILYVRVPSSAWRQEISFVKKDLLLKIRRKTRCTTIRDIVFF